MHPSVACRWRILADWRSTLTRHLNSSAQKKKKTKIVIEKVFDEQFLCSNVSKLFLLHLAYQSDSNVKATSKGIPPFFLPQCTATLRGFHIFSTPTRRNQTIRQVFQIPPTAIRLELFSLAASHSRSSVALKWHYRQGNMRIIPFYSLSSCYHLTLATYGIENLLCESMNIRAAKKRTMNRN